MRNFQTAWENWRKNHRYRGGLGALRRCWQGQRLLDSLPLKPLELPAFGLGVLTFSVVPWLTALWAMALHKAVGLRSRRLVVGDCSGGIQGAWRNVLASESAAVIPCLNHHHGEKLDLFFSKICSSELVVISDDDVFWLDSAPLAWAQQRFAENPTLAAISLAPRTLVSSVLEGKVEEPMGSSCVVIRRPIWIREKLSFKMAPDPSNTEWFYDTCDLAHLELLRRGYQVEMLPPEMRPSLVPLEAVSAWILKAQKHPPERLAEVADLPVRRTKALQALLTAERLLRLAQVTSEGRGSNLDQESKRLADATAAIAGLVGPEERRSILDEVTASLSKIEESLEAPPFEREKGLPGESPG